MQTYPYNLRGSGGLQQSHLTYRAFTTALLMRVNSIFKSCSHPIPNKDDLVIVIVRPTNVGLPRAMDDQRALKKVALVWKELVKSPGNLPKFHPPLYYPCESDTSMYHIDQKL
jgi:hypothetical protein